jgi:hypothetical protein
MIGLFVLICSKVQNVREYSRPVTCICRIVFIYLTYYTARILFDHFEFD